MKITIRAVFLLPYCLLACLALTLAPRSFALEFNVADKQLAACINKLANKNKWTSIQAVTKITCHNTQIKSLQGIEQFTQVEKLSFHKNDLQNVAIANLTRLKELNLARNQLQSMTLNNLPALESLYFFGNKISEVELTDLPELQQIKGNSTEIRIFKYNKLPKLEKVYLFDNQIENIDIYNLPAMTYMDVRQNPMSDELYEEMDRLAGVTILHDGNAEDWK